MPEVVESSVKPPEAADALARTAAKKGPRGQVVIFGTWCKGCGLCVEFCPTRVLALDPNGHPIVVAPEKCSACHWCDTHCPDLAIVVKRIE